MKLYHLLICIILIGCKTSNKAVLEQFCDSSGTCIQNVQKNLSIEIKLDEINSIYYNTNYNDSTFVFTYNFEKNRDPKFVDNNYSEEVIFELNTEDLKTSFTNKTPSKSLFGVFCFCKGKAGYYKIDLKVSYDKVKNQLQVNTPIVVENQIIKSFNIDLNI